MNGKQDSCCSPACVEGIEAAPLRHNTSQILKITRLCPLFCVCYITS